MGEFAISVSKQTLSRELRAWGIASCRRGRAIMRKMMRPSRRLKKLPSPSGGDPGSAFARHTDRALVAGRGARRPEERDHPALGPSRHPAFGAERPAHGIGLYYGAICPAEGTGAALVLPRCNTEGMALHLAEISAAVAPGAHAILLLDQARWHGSGALIAPANITLLPLPSKCPELNPVENVWQFMPDNWLSNRIFK
ncbi:hypothetical protein ACVWZA_004183 [Sphingomonas sp. UYAg733]